MTNNWISLSHSFLWNFHWLIDEKSRYLKYLYARRRLYNTMSFFTSSPKVSSIFSRWFCEFVLKNILFEPRLGVYQVLIRTTAKKTSDRNSERLRNVFPGEMVNIIRIKTIDGRIRGKIESGGWMTLKNTRAKSRDPDGWEQ